MRKTLFIVLLACPFLLHGLARAVPSSKEVTWETSEGPVVFSGKSHFKAGLRCKDCHDGIFQKKRGQAMTMKEMDEGKYCGACHNGKKAFSTADKKNCGRCHRAK